jgi:regulator of chromosome condensation
MGRAKRPAVRTEIPLKSSKMLKTTAFSLDLKYQTVGDVFVVGSGDCAQLGLGPDIFEKERPAKLSYFDELEIVAIFAGGLHTLVLSKAGKLYSWGCNDQKALGRSGEETEPGPVEELDHVYIVDAACGDSISVALSNTGKYFFLM